MQNWAEIYVKDENYKENEYRGCRLYNLINKISITVFKHYNCLRLLKNSEINVYYLHFFIYNSYWFSLFSQNKMHFSNIETFNEFLWGINITWVKLNKRSTGVDNGRTMSYCKQSSLIFGNLLNSL